MKAVYLALLFFLLPVGFAQNCTVTGTVMDSLDNLVEGAEIKLDCGNVHTTTTDGFGTFMVQNLPDCNCRLYARFSDAAAYQITNSSAHLLVKLDKTIISLDKDSNWLLYLSLTVFITIILVLFILFNRKKETNTPPLGQQADKSKILMKALSEREKKIVEFIISQGDHCTQSKIHYETGIPKASLSRNLRNLELKKIVTIHPVGNCSKVVLSEEFK